MSSNPTNARPVDEVDVFAKFLGITAPGEDPVLLLALPSQQSGDEAIIVALQRQLARVAEHPDAATPEADEVRLALHAAAARLLAPHIRKSDAREAAPDGARVSGTEADSAMPMQAAILLTLGMYGGWNTKSFRRMTLLARRQGITGDELAELIRTLTRRSAEPMPVKATRLAPVAPVVAAAKPAPAPMVGAVGAAPRPIFEPAPDEVDPASTVVRNLLLITGLGALGVIAVAVVLIVLVSGSGSKVEDASGSEQGAVPIAVTPAPPAQVFPAPARTTQEAPPEASERLQRVGDWNDVLRELSACAAAIDVDPSGASARFRAIYLQASRTWDEAKPDGLVAAVDGVVEYLYRAGASPEGLEAALSVIKEGAGPLGGNGAIKPDDVMPGAWSAGILARLSREKDLPASVRDQLRSAFNQAFSNSGPPGEASFRAGSIGALSQMPARFTSPRPVTAGSKEPASDPWGQWLRAVAAIDGPESSLYTRSVLLALEWLLINAPEPTQNQGVFDAVGTLVAALHWRSGDESRRWLLRWFEAPSISNADLYAVTSALANRSSAEGVDTSMVLSLAGGESQRTEMRDRYAAVWGMSTAVTRDALLQRLIDDARVALARTDVGTAPAERLGYALSLARLNQAAGMIWSGATLGVVDVLEQVPPKPLTAPAGGGFFSAGPETGWAVRYLSAGHNITQRREIISQVNAAPTVVEAEVLVEAACRGSPPQLRVEARALVMRYASTPAVINALLEFAPFIPQTIDNTQMIELVSASALPHVREPTWRVAVRRALVERLTQALADESDFALIEQLARAFSEAYSPARAAAAAQADPTIPVAEPAPLASPEACAGALRGVWQRQAESLVATGREPMSLPEIATRRSARLNVANGLVQQFAAEQVNICELMGFVVVAEQPSRIGTVVQSLDDLAEARRRAKHVFEQVEAAERARLQMWLARFGGES